MDPRTLDKLPSFLQPRVSRAANAGRAHVTAKSGATHAGLFRGWWIVGVAMIGQSMSVGTVLVYAFGVFAKPLAHDFGTNRASISLALSLLNLMVTLSSPWAGRLVDRLGGRRVIAGSTAMMAFCLLALSMTRTELRQLYALYALAGILGAGATPVAYGRVVANWFDRKRGFALGLASAGIGLGGMIMPSLAQFAIDRGGWRQAYVALAGVCLAIAVPVLWLFLRGTPEEVGLVPDGGASAEPLRLEEPARDLSVVEALRTRSFWQMCGVFSMVSACALGSIAHLSSMLTDQGATGRSAALATSLFGAATLGGRIAAGYLVDRVFAPYVAAALFAGAAAGLEILRTGMGGLWPFFAAALLGLALGAEADIMPFLVSRYFGMRSMGTLFGCVFGAYTVGAAAGPFLLGAGFDATGSYRTPLAYAIGVMALAVAGTLTLGRYRPAQ